MLRKKAQPHYIMLLVAGGYRQGGDGQILDGVGAGREWARSGAMIGGEGRRTEQERNSDW
ncbi:hypothetical protein E2C01_014988 [Portunus trituberculatus]|uniref:Uncharacterized protein n=1 Tax=Portunus trituberculatus TaxID=210409 RepID=A0A5B7DLR5_PORTR|nr:hypothetical protein [Portunus trituberculatus]